MKHIPVENSINQSFKFLVCAGKSKAQALVNLFDSLLENEDGYTQIEDVLDYEVDSLLGGVEKAKLHLDEWVIEQRERQLGQTEY
jgi:hypothetical protein